MRKRDRELREGDMWVNSVGCLFRIESTDVRTLPDGRARIEIRHPNGLGHVLPADKVIECI